MSKEKKTKVIILGSRSNSTNILYNSLTNEFDIIKVIIEKKESKFLFFKRRLKKVGYLKLLDQLFFILFISKLITLYSEKRYKEILKINNLSNSNIDKTQIISVESINSSTSIDLIKSFNADIILLSGTRILSSNLLRSINSKIINIHAGITPYYRGVHGAYWAYLNKQSSLAGVTLHRVDKGIDTGKILGQKIIQVQSSDNFSTYPLLQLNSGIIMLKKFLNNTDKLHVVQSKNKSKLWYHPGFFQYLYYRCFHGVK